MEKKSVVEKLLDPNNNENITLYNEHNQAMEFVQIALIPAPGAIYVILQPAQPMEGVAEDEALVFCLDLSQEDATLEIEEDDSIIDWVFQEYYELLKEVEEE